MNDKREERVAQVIDDFKSMLNLWYERKVTVTGFQEKVLEHLNKHSKDATVAFQFIILAIKALPKAMNSSAFQLLMDAEYFINLYYEAENVGKPYVTPKKLADARDNILSLFRDSFTQLISEQVSADDSRDDMFDNTIAFSTQDVFKGYNKTMRRDVRMKERRNDAKTEEQEKNDPEAEPEEDQEEEDDDDVL